MCNYSFRSVFVASPALPSPVPAVLPQKIVVPFVMSPASPLVTWPLAPWAVVSPACPSPSPRTNIQLMELSTTIPNVPKAKPRNQPQCNLYAPIICWSANRFLLCRVQTHLGFGRRDPDCDEPYCGTLSSVMVKQSMFDLRVKTSNIKNAGKGLFTTEYIKAGSHIGYFGGVRECAQCVKYALKRTTNKFSIEFVEGDVDFGEGDSVLWYLTRCFNSAHDGKMWFVNSSHCRNASKALRTPNVEFCGEGLAKHGHPAISVCAILDIHPGEELLANYMKKIPT